MEAPIDIPDGWARWDLEPITDAARHSADERMVLAGKFVQAMATRRILERPVGSRLRRRMVNTAVRGGFGLLNRSEFEPVLRAMYAEDCEVTYEETFPEMGSGIQLGVDEVHRYLLAVDDAFSSVTYQPVEMLDPGGFTLAGAIKVDVTGRESGITLSITEGIVWTFRDGRVWRQYIHREWPSAVERLKQLVAEAADQPA